MRLPALSIIIGAMLAVSACSPPPAISVEDAYVRLPAVARGPAGAYFTLHGGAKDATLISVGSTVAIRAEMHRSMTSGNMASMKPLAQIALPAKATLVFKPGGNHVMFYDMNPGIKRGSIVPLLFTFSDGQRVSAKAVAIAAGDPPPED
jgi:copper(I)-binding protein